MKKLFIALFAFVWINGLIAGEIDDGGSNDPEITVIESKTVTEGNSGTKSVKLTVKIDECPDTRDIKLRFSTRNGTARYYDDDYKQKSGTVTFAKDNCDLTKTFYVKIFGDTKEEDDEYFYVDYSDNGTNSWNPMSPHQNYHWKNGNDVTEITIENDDGVVLDAGKYLVDSNGNYQDYAAYNVNDTITFVIIAQNQGPNSTQINVEDELTDAVSFIPGSLQILNDVDNYSCSYDSSEHKITCGGSHVFAPDTEAKITFKAKAIREGDFDNYVYITDNNGEHRNGDHVDFRISNLGNGVGITKSVDVNSAQIGDYVNFTIKITNNTSIPRVLKIKDWFPTTQSGERNTGTTYNAFEYISYQAFYSGAPTNNVTCRKKNSSNGPLIVCKNKNRYKISPGKWYTVKIKAKVLKTGRLCNRAHAYVKLGSGNNYMKTGYADACLNVGGNSAPVVNLENKTAYAGSNFTYNIENAVSDPDGDPVNIEVDNLPQSFIYQNGKIKARPVDVAPGVYTVTVKATDDPSSRGEQPKTTTKTFKITVTYPSLVATDNSYTIGVNETLNGNVITDDTGDGSDSGFNLKVVDYTRPSNGTFTIRENGEFSFKPDQDFKGTVSFTYTVKDGSGSTATANVTIEVKTQFNSEFKDFEIINPLETRNIIGNYVIAGNTVECVTDIKLPDDFNISDYIDNFPASGKCVNNRSYYNNKYVVKYIDIDSNNKTWNSSSSYFTIPDSYLKLPNGKGIVWAGLFWQGNVNNSYAFTIGGTPYLNLQRRMDWDSSGNIVTKYIAPGFTFGPLDITQTRANKVLVKIDGESQYHEIEASRFYYDTEDYGDNGATYAAYADITSLLQSKDLDKGRHKITVANILTNEGLEKDNGNYGGWSLVVIYKENFFDGRARNISIYNGFTAVDNTTHGSQQIKISGFKLPKTGTVHSKFSVFAGEGEYVYGSPFKDDDGNEWYDTMRIKRTLSSDGDTMPGAENANNIFDSKLANIERENIGDNNIENTNGIDIDTYDVSNIITNYRNIDENINSVFISISSNKDYITPSMIAFSTELYAPKICYDADVKIGKYIDIETDDRNFTAYNVFNQPLQMKIMIKSQEADFDLLDTKMAVNFTPDDVFKYIPGASKTTYPNTYEYINATDTDSDTGEIAIGHSPTVNGGTLKAKEFTYSKMYYNFNKDHFEGKFDVLVDAKVSFDGVHKVEYKLSTKVPKGSLFHISKCPSNPVYSPVYGTFNIERGDAKDSDAPADRYSLNTQVVGVPYKISVVSYKKGSDGQYDVPNSIKTAVELELIDASTFDNNSSAGFDSICNDPDTYSGGLLVNFNNESRKYITVPNDFPEINGTKTYPENLALRNAAFRVWVLTTRENDEDKIVPYNCSSQQDAMCFEQVYKNYYKDTDLYCRDKCSNSTGSTCYDCLRKHYAKPVCSRDNFAIRPVSYRIKVYDNNETNSEDKRTFANNKNDSNYDIAAGYLYGLDINATRYGIKDETAYGYYLDVFGKENKKAAYAKFADTNPADCNDTSNKPVHVKLFNGSAVEQETLQDNNSSPVNGLVINNTGKYKLHIEDSDWTLVDQKGYKYKPFPQRADCEANSTAFDADSLISFKGCKISSQYEPKYYDLGLVSHPYMFGLDGLNVTPNPDTVADFIYINNLRDTKHLIPTKDVMAMNIYGNIYAMGKNGGLLTNYTKGCSAKNINITLWYDLIKDTSSAPAAADEAVTNSNKIDYSLYVPGIDTDVNVYQAVGAAINIDYNKNYFDDSNGSVLGAAKFNGYFNFEREFNNPVNPFKLKFGKMRVKADNDRSNANLSGSYIPKTEEDLNKTVNVYYARVESQNDFYDDIYENRVNTPVMISIYCDKSLDFCNYFGIDTNTSNATDEYNWWLSKAHNAALGDGKVLLEADDANKASVTPGEITDFVNGIAQNVYVNALDDEHKPYTVRIVPTEEMIRNYPWLLYNNGVNNIAPAYIYKVRFVQNASAWSGKGKTGHTIDVNTSGRKTKKADW